ncbi:PIN domain-containing protein [Streptoalloteichus hindustanus]|uniref:PIN domain nuclease, a component of toxin-antitoxin system (PIN domain) n=1 Tax=Streptoalloteichus hindustanus TaxID=2017 RepID=A0A1M4VLQ0_STRHI|nr:PIN domain-containing protein [Streptoalloteichus hindustanus]SHE69858.1 PIN domain nuclease, a component of toxin-antitoxin system (PIN domain) [Streptoalloteichus hindustanus]
MNARHRLPPGPVLLDASFVLALLDGDQLATRFADLLARSEITAVNLGEVLHALDDLVGLAPDQVVQELAATGLGVHPTDAADARHFPALRRLDRATRRAAGPGGPGGLSLGDICCLARAWSARLPVLTGDRHWLALVRAGLPVPVYDFRDPALRA